MPTVSFQVALQVHIVSSVGGVDGPVKMLSGVAMKIHNTYWMHYTIYRTISYCSQVKHQISGNSMGYDVYLMIDTGKEYTTVVDVGSMTSNVDKMYREAFPADEDDGHRSGIHNIIVGPTASEAIEPLKQAINAMEDSPAIYRAMEPENGWGNYEGALKYLKDILQACEDHPACRVYLSA